MARKPDWAASLDLPEGAQLRRKELFEYTTPDAVYDIELFQNPDGTYYAIGVPRDSERLVVYGSPVVSSKQAALQMVLHKIGQFGLES